ncbi:unnamed protein product [Closterium sp. NIES-54]
MPREAPHLGEVRHSTSSGLIPILATPWSPFLPMDASLGDMLAQLRHVAAVEAARAAEQVILPKDFTLTIPQPDNSPRPPALDSATPLSSQQPVKITIRLLSVGHVDSRPAYHSASEIWPCGYHAVWEDPLGGLCHSEVVEGGSEGEGWGQGVREGGNPVFRVWREDAREGGREEGGGMDRQNMARGGREGEEPCGGEREGGSEGGEGAMGEEVQALLWDGGGPADMGGWRTGGDSWAEGEDGREVDGGEGEGRIGGESVRGAEMERGGASNDSRSQLLGGSKAESKVRMVCEGQTSQQAWERFGGEWWEQMGATWMGRAGQGTTEPRGESGRESGRQAGGAVEDGKSGSDVGVVGEGGVREWQQGEGVRAEYAGWEEQRVQSVLLMDKYGLSHPPVLALIEGQGGAERCAGYEFREERWWKERVAREQERQAKRGRGMQERQAKRGRGMQDEQHGGGEQGGNGQEGGYMKEGMGMAGRGQVSELQGGASGGQEGGDRGWGGGVHGTDRVDGWEGAEGTTRGMALDEAVPALPALPALLGLSRSDMLRLIEVRPAPHCRRLVSSASLLTCTQQDWRRALPMPSHHVIASHRSGAHPALTYPSAFFPTPPPLHRLALPPARPPLQVHHVLHSFLPCLPPPSPHSPHLPALSLPALVHHLAYPSAHLPASAGAASAGSAVTAGEHGPGVLVARMHVALLHLLLPAAMLAVTAREVIGGRERDGRGKEREAAETEARVGVVSGGNGATSAAAATMGSPGSLTGDHMGFSAAAVSDASSDLLMCPIDELTWPEVACRVLAVSTALLQEERKEHRAHGGDEREGRRGTRGGGRRRRGASRRGKADGEEEVGRGSGREDRRQGVGQGGVCGRSPWEQGRLTRCIAGDGGPLLGHWLGTPGAMQDAAALATAEKQLALVAASQLHATTATTAAAAALAPVGVAAGGLGIGAGKGKSGRGAAAAVSSGSAGDEQGGKEAAVVAEAEENDSRAVSAAGPQAPGVKEEAGSEAATAAHSAAGGLPGGAAGGLAGGASGRSSPPQWVVLLEPIRKMQTNVGARIRNCIRAALDCHVAPPDWAVERLQWAISKEVYKGNASGPTKRAAIEVMDKFLALQPSSAAAPPSPSARAAAAGWGGAKVERDAGGAARGDGAADSKGTAREKDGGTAMGRGGAESGDDGGSHAHGKCHTGDGGGSQPCAAHAAAGPTLAPDSGAGAVAGLAGPSGLAGGTAAAAAAAAGPVLSPLMQQCRAVLWQLAHADHLRAFTYFWGVGPVGPTGEGGKDAAEDAGGAWAGGAGEGRGRLGSSAGHVGNEGGPGKGVRGVVGKGLAAAQQEHGGRRVALTGAVNTRGSDGTAGAALAAATVGGAVGGEVRRAGWAPRHAVARPIDLRTIDARVVMGAYGQSAEGFIADVKQMWMNVRVGYRKPHPIFLSMLHLAPLFDKLLASQGLFATPPMLPPRPPTPGPDRAGGRGRGGQAGGEAAAGVPPWSREGCLVCGVDVDECAVLLCDGCDREFHLYCLLPSLARVPRGNWYCPLCVQGGRAREAGWGEEEDDDEEEDGEEEDGEERGEGEEEGEEEEEARGVAVGEEGVGREGALGCGEEGEWEESAMYVVARHLRSCDYHRMTTSLVSAA